MTNMNSNMYRKSTQKVVYGAILKTKKNIYFCDFRKLKSRRKWL